MDSMAPPAAAAPEEAAPEAEVIEEPAPPAPPAPMSLSESVFGEFSARSERNLEVARLQTQLERSQLRRKQVEEVIGEEVAALRFQLEREMAAERIAPRRPRSSSSSSPMPKRKKWSGVGGRSSYWCSSRTSDKGRPRTPSPPR